MKQKRLRSEPAAALPANCARNCADEIIGVTYLRKFNGNNGFKTLSAPEAHDVEVMKSNPVEYRRSRSRKGPHKRCERNFAR